MKPVVAAFVFAFATAASADPLTLNAAADEVVRRNPAIDAAAAQVDAASARSREAMARWLPSLQIETSATRSNNPVFVFGSLLEQGRFSAEHFDPLFLNDPAAMTNVRVAAHARYTLFDGFGRLSATRQAAAAAAAVSGIADEVRQGTLLALIRAWFSVGVAEERVQVAARAVEAAEAAASSLRDRLSEGLVVDAEVLAADVQLAEYRQQRIEADADLAVARAALMTLLQRPHDDPTPVMASLPSTLGSATALDDLVRRAASTRGVVTAASNDVAAARAGFAATRGSLLPRVDAHASWGASGRTFADRDADYALGISASFDLFDGGKFARIAESRAAVRASAAAAASATSAVTMDVVSAFHRLRGASERVAVARLAAQQGAEAMRIVDDRYANGLTTITEKLRAGTAAFRAELDHLAARYDEIVRYAELLRATGDLHNVDPFS